MNLDSRITAFSELGRRLKNLNAGELEMLALRARNANSWFDAPNVKNAINGIALMLDEQYLREWLFVYDFPKITPKKVGIVMAGNIPLVGFHDLLSVLISGHHALVKTSSSDPHLVKYVTDLLFEIEPRFKEYISFVDLLKEADAFIATGSDNTARYFDYYFGKRPHIIRRNRTSIGILTGFESNEELAQLGEDFFRYFGLGCRNVSKVFVPEGYKFDRFFEANEHNSTILEHHKYQNNYDYNKSILLVNAEPHFDNGFMLIRESTQMVSPISVLFYETFTGLTQLYEKVKLAEDKTQVIVSSGGWYPKSIPFGQAQRPMVWDYADGVDTLAFLAGL